MWPIHKSNCKDFWDASTDLVTAAVKFKKFTVKHNAAIVAAAIEGLNLFNEPSRCQRDALLVSMFVRPGKTRSEKVFFATDVVVVPVSSLSSGTRDELLQYQPGIHKHYEGMLGGVPVVSRIFSDASDDAIEGVTIVGIWKDSLQKYSSPECRIGWKERLLEIGRAHV